MYDCVIRCSRSCTYVYAPTSMYTYEPTATDRVAYLWATNWYYATAAARAARKKNVLL